MRLTPMQTKVLNAMHNSGKLITLFTGHNARRLGFGCWPKEDRLVIRAYSNPAYFLKARGLIESTGEYGYAITAKGREAIGAK